MISLKKKITFIILLITISLISLGSFAFVNLGKWLLVNDPLPEKLDVIFTFAGEHKRDIYSKEIAEKYPKAVWVVSCWYDKGKFKMDLAETGFDTARVFTVDTCTSTYSEVKFLKNWLKTQKNQELTVGLVSGPYHMRRISVNVYQNIHLKNVHFKYLSVPDNFYSISFKDNYFKNWWKKPLLISEVKKILYDILRSLPFIG